MEVQRFRSAGRPARAHGPARRALPAAGAVVVLAATLAGLPYLLLRVGTVALPRHRPTWSQVWARLTRPDGGELFLDSLTLVAWMAWAAFALCVVLEAVAAVRGRRAPRLPGLGLVQRLAAVLVAAIIALLASPGASLAAEGGAAQPEAASTVASAVGPVAASTTMAAARTVAPPPLPAAPAQLTYEVAKGDYLGFIAERYLGDFNRYPELARLNQDLIRDPDHIEPHWQLRLPAQAADRGARPHATGTAFPQASETPAATQPPQLPVSAVPSPASEAPAAAPAAAAVAADRAVAAPAAPRPSEGPERDRGSEFAFGAAGLLAALALAAVTRGRSSQRTHHRPGYRSRLPLDGRIETELRVARKPLDIDCLDQALRSLAAGLRRRCRQLPDPVGVVVDAHQVRLLLASRCPDPPSPWQDAGDSWVRPSEDSYAPSDEGSDEGAALLPALATVGAGEDTHLLLDLERIGFLTITGTARRRADLVRYLASELALNAWSDGVPIVLAGFSSREESLLAALHPERVRVCPSVGEAARRALRQIARAAGEDAGSASVLSARLRQRPCAPQVLIVAEPAPAEFAVLRQLAAAATGVGRGRVAVVVAAEPEADLPGWSIDAGADGTLHLPFFWPDPPFAPASLPLPELERLVEILQSARESSETIVPPAAETDYWARHADAAGRLQPDPPAAPARLPAGAIAARDGGHRVVTATVRQRDRAADPLLDADLTAWRERDPSRPRFGILGPVTVEVSGIPPEQRQRFYAEIIIYLAQRGARGADRDRLDAALWPDRLVKDTSRRVAIARTRRWLGETPDGEPWLPDMGNDRCYRLREGYLLDWHLFRRLRARAQARGPAGIGDLRAALELVRGVPLDGADRPYASGARNPYPWLAESDIHPEHLTAAIVDTAHQLAELLLAADDTIGARWAVGKAWLADPARSYDQPWQDLMRAQHRDGHTAALRATFADLLRAREAEVPEDLAPETFQVCLRLLPDLIRAPASAH